MQQSHFNHLVYFHIKQYSCQLTLERLEVVNRQAQILLKEGHSALFILDGPQKNLSSSPEMQKAFATFLEDLLHVRNLAATPLQIANQEFLKAQNELQDYLNLVCPNPTSKARLAIDKVSAKAKEFAQNKFDPESEDHEQRFRDYSEALCEELNSTFQRAYTYQEPLSNNLFMKIITHPAMQTLLVTALIGGLLSLAVGACALSGALPAIAAATALSLTIGGGATAFTSLSLVTAGFFKHRSPLEIDRDKEVLALPTAQAM